jgi:hypothetical protein
MITYPYLSRDDITMASKKEETEDRQEEHNALVAAEAVAKNAKFTKDREEAAENVIILETTPV